MAQPMSDPPQEVEPHSISCPSCNAPPGQDCNVPTVAGRRDVPWVHNARRDLAEGWT
jgi:hypothetical protein